MSVGRRGYVTSHALAEPIFLEKAWPVLSFTHVFREVEQRQHEEDVLLTILQRPIAEVSVVLAIPERELQGEGLVAGGDIGPGFRLAGLPANAQGAADAGSVDLFEQLEGSVRKCNYQRREVVSAANRKQMVYNDIWGGEIQDIMKND